MTELTKLIRTFKDYNVYQYAKLNMTENPIAWNDKLNYFWIETFLNFLYKHDAIQYFFIELNKQYSNNNAAEYTGYKYYEIFTNMTDNRPVDFIDYAFDWEDSSKGTEYWLDLSKEWTYNVKAFKKFGKFPDDKFKPCI